MRFIEYNGSTGDFVRVLVSAGSGGLDAPSALFFAEFNLFVASQGTNEILLYDDESGASLGAFVSAGSGGLDTPTCIDFGFDDGANMFVCSFGTDEILRFNRKTGAFLGVFIPSGDGSLDGPVYIAFKEKSTGNSSCALAAPETKPNLAIILLFAPILFVAVRRMTRS